jgi:hypothetical protein
MFRRKRRSVLLHYSACLISLQNTKFLAIFLPPTLNRPGLPRHSPPPPSYATGRSSRHLCRSESGQDQDVLSWFCLQAVSKPVWHIPLLCVQRKTPDDGQRDCPKHVDFHSKNKFEKLVHIVGFIIRNLSRCTVTWTSNYADLLAFIVSYFNLGVRSQASPCEVYILFFYHRRYIILAAKNVTKKTKM